MHRVEGMGCAALYTGTPAPGPALAPQVPMGTRAGGLLTLFLSFVKWAVLS